jgi:hypothetical protein
MEEEKDLLEQCKDVYRERGYSFEKDFPDEYYFMYNPETGEKVRLYYYNHFSPDGHKVTEYR